MTSGGKDDIIIDQKFINKQVFECVVGCVSNYGLQLLYQQYLRVIKSQLHNRKERIPLPEVCTGSWTTTMAMPCAHKIAAYIESKTQIPLADSLVCIIVN